MECNNVKNIKKFRFKHKGMNRMFRCDSTGFEDMGISGDEITLEFEDLSEVNTLIWMLDRFRNDCKDILGEWK